MTSVLLTNCHADISTDDETTRAATARARGAKMIVKIPRIIDSDGLIQPHIRLCFYSLKLYTERCFPLTEAEASIV